ncbi:hypothetical protein [Propylenella binzhouense]|nr:hypothetical protein [Propylenella binzhouense]
MMSELALIAFLAAAAGFVLAGVASIAAPRPVPVKVLARHRRRG